jgi:formylglycine-generating enzyme required for sulfatase activity
MNRNNGATGALLSTFFCALMAASQIGCGPGTPDVDSKTALPPPAKRENVVLTNMDKIKAGSFPRSHHVVTMTHYYWLGKYEVTQGEYSSVMGKNPSHFLGDPARPVEKLNFADAVAYCAAITKREIDAGKLLPNYSYRLPTEAEWEYACRAGTTNLFSFGDNAADADQFAWTLENSDATTHPVGQKKPNPWGLYDMHGNVWEWCSDWFEPYPARDLQDPVGPGASKFKVFRGGGWNHAVEYARSANRFMMAPVTGIYFVGFRLALGLNEARDESGSRKPE